MGKKASSTSTISGAERTSLGAALQRRLADGKTKPAKAVSAMNAAVIEEDSYLYLGETLIDSGWFADSARIKFVNGVITVWPFGGSIGWPPEPPERWSIVDAGAELKTANPNTGMPPPRSREQRLIQEFVINTYGSKWEAVPTNTIIAAASADKEFVKLFHRFPNRSTFERALGRKKD